MRGSRWWGVWVCGALLAAPVLVLPAPAPAPTADGQHEQATGAAWLDGDAVSMRMSILIVVAAAALLVFGCTWCYRYKLFSPSQSSLHEVPSVRTQPPDSGFHEEPPDPEQGPVYLVHAARERLNNNLQEDNNNGPISFREMQNIENNNAAVYIISENENRNALNVATNRDDDGGAARRNASRESVVEFEPLPVNITPSRQVPAPAPTGVPDQLADWFAPSQDDFPRNRLQYLREIARGSFGRIVEGELESPPDDDGNTSPVKSVAVKILNQNASQAERNKFLQEARVFRDIRHENVLSLLARNLSEEPWLLVFDLYTMDLQQYLITHQSKMAMLNERGVPLRLKCDIASGLSYVHSQGLVYGSVWSEGVLVSGAEDAARARLGHYGDARPTATPRWSAPELLARPDLEESWSSEIWSLGVLLWQVCSWGAPLEDLTDEQLRRMATEGLPPPSLPCPYRDHLYQVMQLCWNRRPECRPSAAQVYALLHHLHTSHLALLVPQSTRTKDTSNRPPCNSVDFEQRWRHLKPNSVPKIDELAVVHPVTSRFTCSDEDFREERSGLLSVEPDNVVSRSSSILSDKECLELKSDSLTNLHGSFEDVRNINYLGLTDVTILESNLESSIEKTVNVNTNSVVCEDLAEKVDPWLKDIIQNDDDISYYKDVSDVLKNLDNILNSEKTSSSESSHQASPLRDNLVLNCKGEFPVQSSLVKSPGISNFQSILEVTPEHKPKESLYQEVTIEKDLQHSDELINVKSYGNVLETDLKNSATVIDCSVNNNKEIKDCIESCDNVKLSDNGGFLTFDENITGENLNKFEQKNESNKNSLSDTDVLLIDNNSTVYMDLTSETPNVELTNSLNKGVEKDISKLCHDFKVKAVDSLEDYDIRQDTTEYLELPTVSGDTTMFHLTEISQNIHKRNKNEMSLKSPPCHLDTTPSNLDATPCNMMTSTPKMLEDVISNSIFDKNFKAHQSEGTDLNCENIELRIDLDSQSPAIKNDNPSPKVEFHSHSSKVENNSDNYNVQNWINISETKNNSQDSIIQNKSHSCEVENYGQTQNYSQRPEIESDSLCPKILNDSQSSESESYSQDPSIHNSNHSCQVENYSQSPNIQNDSHILDIENYSKCTKVEKNSSSSEFESADQGESNNSSEIKNYIKLNDNHELKSFNDHTQKIGCDGHSRPEFQNESCVDVKSLNFHNESSAEQEVVPDYGPGVVVTRLDQHIVPVVFQEQNKESNYHQKSSVILGPFDNCTLDFFTGIKTNEECKNNVIPTEERLAFSSDFTDVNLESGSFKEIEAVENDAIPKIKVFIEKPEILFKERETEKNYEKPELKETVEVVEIITQEEEFENIEIIPDIDTVENESLQYLHSVTNFSPTTPPNSPGNLLGSPQYKYLIHDHITNSSNLPNYSESSNNTCNSTNNSQRSETNNTPNMASDEPLDIETIQIQITTKMAMAENENNFNIEYSGPHSLDIETLPPPENLEDIEYEDDVDTPPECNICPRVEDDFNDGFILFDEESMKALRSELELKLPLAQASVCESLEPCLQELPPPPSDDTEESTHDQIVVCYPGALSPIVEETRQQLSAYENDINCWSANRTDSSESYPEPCNNSTDDLTDLPTAMRSAHTLNNVHNNSDDSPGNTTYTLHEDHNKEITMSVDSLNESDDGTLKDVAMPSMSAKIPESMFPRLTEIDSPLNDDRISQVSPFILSPSTETSKVHTDSNENGSNISRISKPTLPSSSKDTQCLSKATSIDSWCSNDTLFNVEDNFDELVIESEGTYNKGATYDIQYKDDIENDKDDTSQSSGTLTQDEDRSKQGSTYIIHSSKSDKCGSFTPDSITANYTYTKVKAETPAMHVEKCENNIYTKDLTHGTLLLSANCNDILSTNDLTIEQMRRSPIDPIDLNLTPPTFIEHSLKIDDLMVTANKLQPVMAKMDSVEIGCLKENSLHDLSAKDLEISINNVEAVLSPEQHYRCMANSVTSTPLVAESKENIDDTPIPAIKLTEIYENMPDFAAFVNSAELRPQDISPYANGNVSRRIGEADHSNGSSIDENISKIPDNFSFPISVKSTDSDDKTPGFSEFALSANCKPQEMTPFGLDSQINRSTSIAESISSTLDFLQFERSAQERPQELFFLEKADKSVLNKYSAEVTTRNNKFGVAINSLGANNMSDKSHILTEELCLSRENMLPDQTSNMSGQSNNTDNSETNVKDSELVGPMIDRSVPDSKDSSNPENVTKECHIEEQECANSVLEETTDSSMFESISRHAPQIFGSPAIDSTMHSDHIEIDTTNNQNNSGLKIKNDCPNFSEFECSVQTKPQELSSFTSHNNKPPNTNNMNESNQSANFSSFERSASAKPQDISSMSKDINVSAHTQNSSLLSQNFNETYETFDSHPSRKFPLITVHNETSDGTDTSHDKTKDKYEDFIESAKHDKIKKRMETDYKLSELCDALANTGCVVMSDNRNSSTENADHEIDETVYHILLNSAPLDIITNNEEHNSILAIIPNQDQEVNVQRNDDSHVSVTNDTNETNNEHHSVLANVPDIILPIYLPESENDSLVSVTETTQSDTMIEKGTISTVSIEESEPTTKEMDSLDTHLEFINEEALIHHVSPSRSKDDIIPTKMLNGEAILADIIHKNTVLKEISAESNNVEQAPSTCSPIISTEQHAVNGINTEELCSLTNNFIENEKSFCGLDAYLPLLTDIRFTGPSSDYMSTSFNQDSPTDDDSMILLETELKKAERNAAALANTTSDFKEWESESEDSQSNSTSSGEFIWKDGDGQEIHLTPSTNFDDHQQNGGAGGEELGSIAEGSEGAAEDGGSMSGSEGDEVEFVPSSWDCQAEPTKSSIKSVEQSPLLDGKKRVVFKQEKYQCVYEYPRELSDECDALTPPPHPAHFAPQYPTYAGVHPVYNHEVRELDLNGGTDWETVGGVEAYDAYGQYMSAPLHLYRVPETDGAFSPNYAMPDDDFFISSSARPFESLGVMSTTSQFFPGIHATLKAVSSLEEPYEYPPPPSPLASVTATPETTLSHQSSVDFTTPDSGVEDITPGSTLDDDLKVKLRAEIEDGKEQTTVKPDRSLLKLGPADSTSSSESQSPSSPCWEALGGLRHTRDRLKLDLPPSPLHVSSPSRHSQRVFNFLTVESPKIKKDINPLEKEDATPLIMTDETPIVNTLPIPDTEDIVVPEPTFSTFGKTINRSSSTESKPIVLSDESRSASVECLDDNAKPLEVKNKPLLEAVRGEGTVLDSGDEDSGIESSAKTTLERNVTTDKTTVKLRTGQSAENNALH